MLWKAYEWNNTSYMQYREILKEFPNKNLLERALRGHPECLVTLQGPELAALKERYNILGGPPKLRFIECHGWPSIWRALDIDQPEVEFSRSCSRLYAIPTRENTRIPSIAKTLETETLEERIRAQVAKQLSRVITYNNRLKDTFVGQGRTLEVLLRTLQLESGRRDLNVTLVEHLIDTLGLTAPPWCKQEASTTLWDEDSFLELLHVVLRNNRKPDLPLYRGRLKRAYVPGYDRNILGILRDLVQATNVRYTEAEMSSLILNRGLDKYPWSTIQNNQKVWDMEAYEELVRLVRNKDVLTPEDRALQVRGLNSLPPPNVLTL